MSEEILKTLVDEVPEVESALVIDEDGIVVYRYDGKETSIDSEELATQLVNPIKSCDETINDLTGENDQLEEVILFSGKYAIFIYKLVNETFLVVVTKRTPLYGRTRFKLRSKLPKLIKAL